jgi:hypothetical protein
MGTHPIKVGLQMLGVTVTKEHKGPGGSWRLLTSAGPGVGGEAGLLLGRRGKAGAEEEGGQDKHSRSGHNVKCYPRFGKLAKLTAAQPVSIWVTS